MQSLILPRPLFRENQMSKIKSQNCRSKLKILTACLPYASLRRCGWVIFTSSLLAFSLASTPKVKAQNVIGLVAIPPRVEDLSANPGEVVTREIKLQNQGESELAISASSIDFIVEDKKGIPTFLKEGEYSDNRWALSSWTNISPTQFIIKPGEVKKVDLVIIVPDDALPGGHYAAITYQPADSLDSQNTGAKIVPSVATLVYLTVNGDIEENAVIRKMDIPKFSEYGPIPVTTEIENLSDIHLRPTGVIRIYNLLNRLSTSLSLETQNIFPGQSRTLENTWNKKWLFGRYKAKLEGTYGTQGGVLLAVAYFWVIPWKLILIALLVLTLIILTVIYFRRKRQAVVKQEMTKEKPAN